MKTKTTIWINAAILVLSILAGMYFWNELPNVMASHWDVNDQVNGTMNKFWGTFMLPIVLVAITLLLLAVPYIDPLKQNIEEFRPTFNMFITMLSVFFAYNYSLSLAWNLGAQFKMSQMILPGIGIIFVGSGYLITQAKRNYFIGIRTPWTLANDVVWDKTHAIGGKLFVAAGVITMLSAFASQYAFPIMMVAIFGTVIYTTVYSYVIFTQIQRSTK